MCHFLPVAGSDAGARRIRAGEEVEFDGLPGEYMEPLDDAAWEKHFEYAAKRYKRFPFKVREPQPQVTAVKDYSAVTIPDDWRDLPGMAICHLAVKLGAPRLIKRHKAFEFVEKVAAERGMVAPVVAEDEPEAETAEDEQEMTDGQ